MRNISVNIRQDTLRSLDLEIDPAVPAVITRELNRETIDALR